MENIYYPIELFVTQEQWREQQINKILYENNTNTVEMEIPKVASQTKPDFI